MSAQVSYPGVYIQEISSGAHTISGVATSIAAFVGYTARGIDNRAGHLFSFSDFERKYGGIAPDSELSYSVQHFFDNGGTECYVVRTPKSDAVAATVTLYSAVAAGQIALGLTAISKGAWANRLVVDVDYGGVSDASSFNVMITDRTTGAQESFPNISADSTSASYCVKVINDPDSGSALVIATTPPAAANARPCETGSVGAAIALPAGFNTQANGWTLGVSLDLPAALTPVTNVQILAINDAVPSSTLGWARLVERKINSAISATVAGAAVRCLPNAAGTGLRVYADCDPTVVSGGVFDAAVTFSAGSPAATSLFGILGLPGAGGGGAANPEINVGHYVLGVGRRALAENQGGAPQLGVDGSQLPATADLIGDPALYTGIYALDRVDLFNILCIPDATRAMASDPGSLDPRVDPNSVYAAALSFFQSANRRAFLLIDAPPPVSNVDRAADWKSFGLAPHDKNAAAYFPRLRLPDSANQYKLRTFAPCGVVAGVYARTDATRGVWKAPAGVEATLNGVQGQVYALTDLENGVLNKLGLNCMRDFPVYGNVSWGARTLVGSDQEASDWKYVPVRRLALYLEESLFRGTKWVVFEPNDEKLWAQIRLNVGAFMHDMFRQGAFQGTTPTQAYLVKCDSETTTQTDINNGIVNILVAFAPLKPAEFVVITIQQLAGQIQT
jgi:phage tail sheath protein FI